MKSMFIELMNLSTFDAMTLLTQNEVYILLVQQFQFLYQGYLYK